MTDLVNNLLNASETKLFRRGSFRVGDDLAIEIGKLRGLCKEAAIEIESLIGLNDGLEDTITALRKDAE